MYPKRSSLTNVQICQFCYNNIKTTMNGLCPACRRPYDDKPHSFKNVTQEELLQFEKNKLAQQKKRAAAKQKEAQKREADNLSRKHLAGLRVRQKNLVYVTGMRPKIQGDRVAELLRANDYFGQYGEIIKVVVSKSKDAAHTPNQPVGIYVTFARKEDAAACIEAINARAETGDGKIRYGFPLSTYWQRLTAALLEHNTGQRNTARHTYAARHATIATACSYTNLASLPKASRDRIFRT
jgi:CCR4-NOT transcription complex subunit 4